MTKAIFPGSFDPLTLGHLDIIQRASALFEEVCVVILENSEKKSLFSIAERLAMIQENCKSYANVTCAADTCLTVAYAKKRGATVILRGVRSVKDYEYELDIASANAYLEPSIETVLLFSNGAYAFISSSIIREMMKYGADISKLVPEHVKVALEEKYRNL